MRMARHVRDDGLVVIDDAYNANPESVAAALHALAGIGRAADASRSSGRCSSSATAATTRTSRSDAWPPSSGVDRVVAVGDRRGRHRRGSGGARPTAVDDVDDAVRVLSAWLTPADVVLVKASRGVRLERVTEALLGR